MKDKIKIIIIAGLIFFAGTYSVSAKGECHWIYSEKNDVQACQRVLGEDGQKWQTSPQCDASSKGQYDTNCCCPVESSKKYIIIGSLVAIFGVITILSFALRKNETQ